MEENIRYIKIIDALKKIGKISSYTEIAKILNSNKAALSDIKGNRKALSIDMLRRLKNSYSEINIEWVVMGTGDMFLSDDAPPRETFEGKDIKYLIDTITRQAEEIGKLRHQLATLHKKQ